MRLVEGTTLDGEKIMVHTDMLPGDYLKPLKLEEIKTSNIKRLLHEYKALAIDIDNSHRPLQSDKVMLKEIENEIIKRTNA
jgi:hypothetical protein